MNADHLALFAGVLAAPDDDLPRLVFADWLEESGAPANVARAGYIRAQIEAEAHAPGSGRRMDLNRRCADLRDRFRDEWDEAFRDPNDWYNFTATRRRGFVDEVVVGLSRFIAVGRRMFSAAPVRVLELVDGGTAAEWIAFVDADYLTSLQELRLARTTASLGAVFRDDDDVPRWVAGEAFEAIMSARGLVSLRRLDLSGQSMLDPFAEAFLSELPNAAFADRLMELDVSRTALSAHAVRTLASGLPGQCRLVASRLNIGMMDVIEIEQRFGPRVLL